MIPNFSGDSSLSGDAKVLWLRDRTLLTWKQIRGTWLCVDLVCRSISEPFRILAESSISQPLVEFLRGQTRSFDESFQYRGFYLVGRQESSIHEHHSILV